MQVLRGFYLKRCVLPQAFFTSCKTEIPSMSLLSKVGATSPIVTHPCADVTNRLIEESPSYWPRNDWLP